MQNKVYHHLVDNHFLAISYENYTKGNKEGGKVHTVEARVGSFWYIFQYYMEQIIRHIPICNTEYIAHRHGGTLFSIYATHVH